MSEEPVLVLIAEDEPLASMALRAQVDALGYEVAGVARTGVEAADLARVLPIGLGIFDMKMPAMTGIDAAFEAFPSSLTPVLLLTGFGAADLPDPIPEPPIFAVVTKPVGLIDLRNGILAATDRFRAWVDREGREDERRRALDERAIIARALEAFDDGPTADAASRFLERARAEGADPVDLARRLLDDGAGPER